MVKVIPMPDAKKPPSKPWPTQQKVQALAETLDEIKPLMEAMRGSRLNLRRQEDYFRRAAIPEAKKSLEHFQVRGYANAVKDEKLEKRLDEVEPEGWWDDNGDVVFSEVAKMITLLMGSFPTSKIPEPEIFVRVLLDDVMVLQPSFVELESACRHLRQTQKFMPSISEVIDEIKRQEKLWSVRWSTAVVAEEIYNDLRDALAEATAPPPAIEHKPSVPMQPIKQTESEFG